jgi:hypothetical protein
VARRPSMSRVARERFRTYPEAVIFAERYARDGYLVTIKFAAGRNDNGRHDGRNFRVNVPGVRGPGRGRIEIEDERTRIEATRSSSSPTASVVASRNIGRRQPDSEDQWKVTSRDGMVTGKAAVLLRGLPRRGMNQYQGKLREALRDLAPINKGALLEAVYSSADRRRCDLENVLLTNVGYGNIRHLVAAGVRLERDFRELDAPYVVSYQSVPPETPWRCWCVHSRLATIEARLAHGPLTSKAVWGAVKRGAIHVLGRAPGEEPILVQIELFGNLSIDRPLKPLIDGLVSALHTATTYPDDACLARIAREAQASVANVRQWLSDPAAAVLGSTPIWYPEIVTGSRAMIGGSESKSAYTHRRILRTAPFALTSARRRRAPARNKCKMSAAHGNGSQLGPGLWPGRDRQRLLIKQFLAGPPHPRE